MRSELAYYYAVISDMDRQIGRMLKALDESGQAENTIVVFSSDHGVAIGSHGLRGKQNMYEHTIGVPLVLRGPGIPRGARRTAQVYLRDLYPTVCELAAIAVPATVQARSVAAVLRGDQDMLHPSVFGYFRAAQRMIRGERWKLIVYPAADRKQLFDLARDPLEMEDVSMAPQNAAVVERLLAELKSWQQAVDDPLVNVSPPQ